SELDADRCRAAAHRLLARLAPEFRRQCRRLVRSRGHRTSGHARGRLHAATAGRRRRRGHLRLRFLRLHRRQSGSRIGKTRGITGAGTPTPGKRSASRRLTMRQPRIFISSVALIFTAAFTLRVIPLIFWPSIAVPDEILQSVEQGHRLAFGYGLVPWEFEYAARSWLLAYASAGLMWLASLMGDGPAYYLPLIGATCAALSAATAVCAFLWGNRFYGIRGGLLSAMVPMTSLDDIYFGARTSSEAVAAHILVIAVYLLAPGDPVKSRWRLASAGFLLALTSVIRIQLLPAIALAFLWGD